MEHSAPILQMLTQTRFSAVSVASLTATPSNTIASRPAQPTSGRRPLFDKDGHVNPGLSLFGTGLFFRLARSKKGWSLILGTGCIDDSLWRWVPLMATRLPLDAGWSSSRCY